MVCFHWALLNKASTQMFLEDPAEHKYQSLSVKFSWCPKVNMPQILSTERCCFLCMISWHHECSETVFQTTSRLWNVAWDGVSSKSSIFIDLVAQLGRPKNEKCSNVWLWSSDPKNIQYSEAHWIVYGIHPQSTMKHLWPNMESLNTTCHFFRSIQIHATILQPMVCQEFRVSSNHLCLYELCLSHSQFMLNRGGAFHFGKTFRPGLLLSHH